MINILARYGFLLIIAAFFIFFALYNPAFLTVGNQLNMIEGSAVLLILALGMTLVVAVGGIDLSVGIAFDMGAAFIATVVLIAYFIFLERSILGKRIHAIGLQRSAANVAGIAVRKYIFLVFVIASATCAIGGLIGSANIRMFTPLAGFSYLLDAIAAVFIGASIHPKGRPNVIGTLIGVLFLGMIARSAGSCGGSEEVTLRRL